MAAQPPPYPPPSQDPREQQKAYWRAQKEGLRAQRDYWKSQRRDQRYYWRAMHRPSIVGPAVLLSLGVVALLVTSGKLSAPLFWDWFIRWWPIVLVGVGLVSLLEWFLDRDQPYRRSSSGFGVIVLVFILLGIAYSQHHVSEWSRQMGMGDPGDWRNFMGEEHDHDVDQNVPIPANAAVQIQNPRGDVTITASGDSLLHIHAHQMVHTNSDRDADKTFPALDPKITVNGTSVLVKVEGRPNGNSDLTIELPASVSTDVTAGHGDVSLEGLAGGSNVTASNGDVKLSSMASSVHVHMSKGDFSASQIGGGVALDGHINDVTVTEVAGTVALDGEFFGDTHLSQVASTVHFHSSRTELDLARLYGDLTMDSDDLHIGQGVGPLRIITRSKNIDCSQISGDVHIENTNGEVNVTAVEPLGNIQITNSSEPVTLTLPPNAGFTINANADGGDLNSEFNLNENGDDNHHNASGTIGKGGSKIDLNVRHGDISIKRGDVNVPPPPPMPHIPALPKVSAPPAPPSPPGIKHLHAPPDMRPPPSVL